MSHGIKILTLFWHLFSPKCVRSLLSSFFVTNFIVIQVLCIFHYVLGVWTHRVILSFHLQSDRCSLPHGKTFLMTMSPSFRSKTAILTQVRSIREQSAVHNNTLCNHILQLFVCEDSLMEWWRSQMQFLMKQICIWWDLISFSPCLCVIV